MEVIDEFAKRSRKLNLVLSINKYLGYYYIIKYNYVHCTVVYFY